MSRAFVSAIVTAYQFERFIGAAIASIQAQTRPVDEIVVVDNRSTDATPAILADLARADPRLMLLDVEPKGPAHARNRGLEAARGEIVAMLDGDDCWPRDKTEAQLARLESDPDVAVVTGRTAFTDAIDPKTLAPPPDARVEAVVHVNIGACLYRRSVFDTVGGFDETFRYADDTDLMLRIRDAGLAVAALDRTALYHRRYSGSLMTEPGPRQAQEFARAVGLSHLRRRKLGLPPAPPLFEAMRA